MKFKVIKYLVILFLLISCRDNNTKSKEISKYEELKLKMLSTYKEDNYTETLKHINQLLQIDTADGDIFFIKGRCEAELNNFNQSTKSYLKAAQLNYRKLDATFNIGVISMLNCDSLAEIYFKKCLAIDPDYEPAKVQLNGIREHPSKYYSNCK